MKLPEQKTAASNVEPADSAVASVARALPAGASLGEFDLGEIIGAGSTTIVYAATDRARAIPVAMAEYMPAKLAQRHEAQVAPRTSAQADAFAKGLKAFINEARTLARCNHPSLVRVVRLWEANGTAYRVMPRYPARRLLEARQTVDEPPDEKAVRALLDALLGALGIFHQAAGGHGKVTPSNILLLPDDRPLLLGPGAAGRAIAGDRIDALMTSEEPCFAPIEQMVESADIALRPSVDLYALAGVARYWISGQLPAPAFGAPESPRRERLADTVQRLRLTWPRLQYSAALLDALDGALSIYPAERPQDVAQMRARLGIAPATAGGRISATSTSASALSDRVPPSPAPAAESALNDAVPASPEPLSQPAPTVPQTTSPDRVTQDLGVVTSSAPDPGPLATSGLARVDDDPSVRTPFARQVRKPRRFAKWSGAVLVLLALLLIGVFEFGQEGPVVRMLDTLGISHGTAVRDSAAVSASAVVPCGAGATAGRRERGAGADRANRRGLAGERHRARVSRQRTDCCGRGGREAGADGAHRRGLTGGCHRARTCCQSQHRDASRRGVGRSGNREPTPHSHATPNAWCATTCRARPDQPARGLRFAHAVLAVPLHENAVQPAPVGIA